MHVESPLKVKKEVNNETKIRSTIYVSSDKKLEEIFVRTYGKSKRDNTLFDKKETYDEITSVNNEYLNRKQYEKVYHRHYHASVSYSSIGSGREEHL